MRAYARFGRSADAHGYGYGYGYGYGRGTTPATKIAYQTVQPALM